MGFKNLDKQASFADFILKVSMDKNRCLEQLMAIKDSMDWPRLEAVLISHYTVGKSVEGADVYPIEFEDYSIRAYSPLVLFKCLLLQKWFRPS